MIYVSPRCLNYPHSAGAGERERENEKGLNEKEEKGEYDVEVYTMKACSLLQKVRRAASGTGVTRRFQKGGKRDSEK